MFLTNISILTSTKCVHPLCTPLVNTWVFSFGPWSVVSQGLGETLLGRQVIHSHCFSTCGSSLLTTYTGQQWSAWRPHTHGETNINCQNYSLLEIAAAAKLLQSCPTLCDPIDSRPPGAAHQAPPSLGFSRQGHWSGLPFPSPMHESEKWKWSCLVLPDSSQPHGL